MFITNHLLFYEKEPNISSENFEHSSLKIYINHNNETQFDQKLSTKNESKTCIC